MDTVKFEDIHGEERIFQFNVASAKDAKGKSGSIGSYEDDKTGIRYELDYDTKSIHEISKENIQGVICTKTAWKTIDDNKNEHIIEKIELGRGEVRENDTVIIDTPSAEDPNTYMTRIEKITKNGETKTIKHNLSMQMTENAEVTEDKFMVDGIEHKVKTTKSFNAKTKTVTDVEQLDSFVTFDEKGKVKAEHRISHKYRNGAYISGLETVATGEIIEENFLNKEGVCVAKTTIDRHTNRLMKKTEDNVEYTYEYDNSWASPHVIEKYTSKNGVQYRTERYSDNGIEHEHIEENGLMCVNKSYKRGVGSGSFVVDNLQYNEPEAGKLQDALFALGLKDSAIKEGSKSFDAKTGILKMKVVAGNREFDVEFMGNNFVKKTEKDGEKALNTYILETKASGKMIETEENFSEKKKTVTVKDANKNNISQTVIENEITTNYFWTANIEGERLKTSERNNKTGEGEESNKTIVDENGIQWTEVVTKKDANGISYKRKKQEVPVSALVITEFTDNQGEFHYKEDLGFSSIETVKNKEGKEIKKTSVTKDKDGVATLIVEDSWDENLQRIVTKKSQLEPDSENAATADKRKYKCTYTNGPDYRRENVYLEEVDIKTGESKIISFSKGNGIVGEVVYNGSVVLYEQFDEKDANGIAVKRTKSWLDTDGCFHTKVMSKKDKGGKFLENEGSTEAFIDNNGVSHSLVHISDNQYSDRYTDNRGVKHDMTVTIDPDSKQKKCLDRYEDADYNTKHEILTLYNANGLVEKIVHTTIDKDGVAEKITDEMRFDKEKNSYYAYTTVSIKDKNNKEIEQFTTYGHEEVKHRIETAKKEINGKTVQYELDTYFESGKKTKSEGKYKDEKGIEHVTTVIFGKDGTVVQEYEKYSDKGIVYTVLEGAGVKGKSDKEFGVLQREITYTENAVNHTVRIYDKDGVKHEVDSYNQFINDSAYTVVSDTCLVGKKLTVTKTYTPSASKKGKAEPFTITSTQDASGNMHEVDSRNPGIEIIIPKNQKPGSKQYKYEGMGKNENGADVNCKFDVQEYEQNKIKHVKTTRQWDGGVEIIDCYKDAEGKTHYEGEKYFDLSIDGSKKMEKCTFSSFVDNLGRETVNFNMMQPKHKASDCTELKGVIVYEADKRCSYRREEETIESIYLEPAPTSRDRFKKKEVKHYSHPCRELYFGLNNGQNDLLCEISYTNTDILGTIKVLVDSGNGKELKQIENMRKTDNIAPIVLESVDMGGGIHERKEVVFEATGRSGDGMKEYRTIVKKVKESDIEDGKKVASLETYERDGVAYRVSSIKDVVKNEKGERSYKETEQTTEFVDVQGKHHVEVRKYDQSGVLAELDQIVQNLDGTTESHFYKISKDKNGLLHLAEDVMIEGRMHHFDCYTDKNGKKVTVESYIGNDWNVYFAETVGGQTKYYKKSMKDAHTVSEYNEYCTRRNGFAAIDFNGNPVYEEVITQTDKDGKGAVTAKIETKKQTMA